MPLSTMNQYGVIRLTTNHKDENAKQTEKSLIPKKYTERSMVEDKQEARPEDFLSEEDIKRAELIQKRLARRAQRAPKSPNNPKPKEWLAKDWSRGKSLTTKLITLWMVKVFVVPFTSVVVSLLVQAATTGLYRISTTELITLKHYKIKFWKILGLVTAKV